MDLPKPEKPTGPSKDGFAYDHDGLTILAYRRNSAEEIKEILSSDDVGRAILNITPLPGKARARGHKPWYSAQLSHYGIPFASIDDTAKLKSRLQDAVSSGKCDKVPAKILARERKLSDLWKPKIDAYDNELAKYNQLQDIIFKNLGSPIDEAEFDSARFISKYFLDSQGNADPTKTPDMMILPGLTFRYSCDVEDAARKIPNLYSAHKMRADQEIFFIGWNKNTVRYAAETFEEEACRSEEVTNERNKKALLEQHKMLERHAKEFPEFYLDDIAGSYMVECEQIESQWPTTDWQDVEILQLNITRNGYGTFHFRVLEGAMYLNTYKPRARLDSNSDSDSGIGDGSSEDEGEDEDRSEDEVEDETEDEIEDEDEVQDDVRDGDEDEVEDEVENEDEVESEDDHGPGIVTRSRKRKASTECDDRSAKRQDTVSKKSRKVRFTWSGHETGEGELQEEDPYKVGFLKFNETWTAFDGIMHIGFVGEKCVLKGYKVSHVPVKTPSTVWGGFVGEPK